MESRTERHRRDKNRSSRKKTPFKLLAGFLAASAVCFSIGVGAAYVSTRSDDAELRQEAQEQPAADEQAPAAAGTPSGQEPGGGTKSDKSGNAPSAAPGESGHSDSSAGDRVRLSFVGDLMFAGKVEEILQQKGYDYPYTNVRSYLSEPDFTIANLETPITGRGEMQSKDYVYRSSAQALPALTDAGIDLVNLANNHVLDYGQEGLFDTFGALDGAGIRRVGAGADAEEAYRPVIVEKQGVKIAFLGFSRVVPESSWVAGAKHPGVAETYNYKQPVAAIQKAKEQADLVVVLAHWGVEREDQPDKHQKEMAHRYIDAGADLVVGGHPHVLQGFERYKDKWIAYSLGNFIFTTNTVPKTWETVILQAACTKRQECDLQLVPVLTKSALPTPMNREDGAKLFERLSGISIGAAVDENGKVTAHGEERRADEG